LGNDCHIKLTREIYREESEELGDKYKKGKNEMSKKYTNKENKS
jgi:hypothetical protein